MLTGDHTTLAEVGDHSFEPVPFAISNIAACAQLEIVSSGDAVEKYSEIDAVRGHLGRFPGAEVMTLLQKYQHHITSST